MKKTHFDIANEIQVDKNYIKAWLDVVAPDITHVKLIEGVYWMPEATYSVLTSHIIAYRDIYLADLNSDPLTLAWLMGVDVEEVLKELRD